MARDERTDHFAHDETEDLSKVKSCDHLLKGLLSRLVGGGVDGDIVARSREVLVCGRVEGAPGKMGFRISRWESMVCKRERRTTRS